MALYDLVLEYLQNKSYCPKEEDYGIVFKVEDLNFNYIREPGDDQNFLLCLFAATVTDVNNDIELAVLKAMDETNASVKGVKLYYNVGGIEGEYRHVWLAFDILLDKTPDIGNIIDRAIFLLLGAREYFYNLLFARQLINLEHHD